MQTVKEPTLSQKHTNTLPLTGGKKKAIYGLRTRFNDTDNWSEPSWYKTAKQRDKTAAMNRIIGGIRTWSFQERKTLEEIDELWFE